MTDESKIEYEPTGEPLITKDGYDVYVYEPADGEIVPDIIITRRENDEHFRLWGYQGLNGLLVLCIHTDHKHPPDFPDADCHKWSIYDGDPFPALEDAPPTPDEVTSLAIDYSDAPVLDNTRDAGPMHGGDGDR